MEDQVTVAVLKEQVGELREQNKDFEKRITAIETSRQKTEFQYEQIMRALNKLNDVTIPNLVKDLETLKNKPAKKWETAINAVIAGVVAVVVSMIFKGVK